MVVLAENEQEAISDAHYEVEHGSGSDECLSEWAKLVESRKDLPYGWDNSEPYGVTDNEDLMGTCGEIFQRIEEKEAETKRKEAIRASVDRRQLKFDFDES